MNEFWKLFPIVLKSGAYWCGREKVFHHQSELLFVLICDDLTENSRQEVIKRIGKTLPIICITDREKWWQFGLKGIKILGIKKSPIGKELFKRVKLYYPHLNFLRDPRK